MIDETDQRLPPPLVSVHIITYNHERYIAQAIDGVLNQERDFPIEIVVGEDCSTDRTREIVFDYRRRYPNIIRVVTSENNVGVVPNFIRTQDACRGKYIAHCEGDDYWHHSQKLKKQIAYMEAHPDCGFLHSDYDRYEIHTGQRTNSANRVGGFALPEMQGEELFRAILTNKYYYIAMCTLCMRRDLAIKLVNDNPEMQSGRFRALDVSLALESSRITRFKYLNESLATHNILPESVSKSLSNPAKVVQFCKASTQMRMFYVEKYHCSDDVRRDLIVSESGYLLTCSFDARDAESAREARSNLKNHGARLRLVQHLEYWGTLSPLVHIPCQQLFKLRPILGPLRRRICSRR